VPWVIAGVLNLPTTGLSTLFVLGAYAYLCLWSCLCAKASFDGAKFDAASSKLLWLDKSKSARPLGLAFLAIAASSYAWSVVGMEASGIGRFLEEFRSAASQEEARMLVSAYWDREGLDGLAWGIAIQQMGWTLACSLWCLLPMRHLERPGDSAKALLAFGASCFAKAPWAMLTLGASGALIGQMGLAFAPAALLSGFWFVACSFAYRDLASHE
jgi:hypothetical protein